MIQLTDKHWAVEVPDDAQNFEFEIEAGENWYRLNYLIQIDDVESGFYGEWEQWHIDLLPGNWQFLFTTKEATEEDAAKVVGVFAVNIASTYRNYMWPQGSDFFWRASDSLKSLLKAKGCDGNKNEAIIQKL